MPTCLQKALPFFKGNKRNPSGCFVCRFPHALTLRFLDEHRDSPAEELRLKTAEDTKYKGLWATRKQEGASGTIAARAGRADSPVAGTTHSVAARGQLHAGRWGTSVTQPPPSLPALNAKTKALLDLVSTESTKEVKVSTQMHMDSDD